MNRRTLWIGLALASLIIWMPGCGGGSGTTPTNTVLIVVTSGSGQSTAIGTQFMNPLVATVTTNGSPTSGQTVTFTPPANGASVTFAGGVNTATTNANGVATSAVVSANTTVGGPYNVSATVSGAAVPADFSLTNTAGPAAGITCPNGSGQNAVVSMAFTNPLAVQVVDGAGNSVSDPGVVVTFTPPAQTVASATFAGGVNTATTIANGSATSVTVSANGIAGGPYVISASATIAGLVKGCNFMLTNTAGPSPTVTVKSGTPQSAVAGMAFAAPLVATVRDNNGNLESGVIVTFTPPGAGASATFAGGVNTATSDVNGVATSMVVSANGILGGPYMVQATIPNGAAPAPFMLTNTAENFTFYVSGLETINPVNDRGDLGNFYALAGAFTINPVSGAVVPNGGGVGGEQDYNDGTGVTSKPAGDSITGGQLNVDPATGQGTLTLDTSNLSLGVGGTEEFGVQFVNSNHALIVQFDGSATSSGSLDLQTLPNPLAPPSGSFAFTLSGVDPESGSFVAGGVFAASGTSITSGTYDCDIQGSATFGTAIPGGAKILAPDAFGRGTITGSDICALVLPNSAPVDLTFRYYVIGPEAMRIIDVDTTDTAFGSAFGQGSGPGPFTIGNSVFSVASSSWGPSLYAAIGMFTPTPGEPAVRVRPEGIIGGGSGTFSGLGDDNELDSLFIVSQASISGNYTFNGSGYGNVTITSDGVGDEGLGDVSYLGIYMVDPNLNINDPNNPAGGGGALVADLDDFVLGTGVLVPQTDNTSASFFAGNNYAFGAQDFNYANCCVSEFEGWELDVVGQGSVSAGGVLSGTGTISDPFDTLGGSSLTYQDDVPFTGTAVPVGVGTGPYTMFTSPYFEFTLPDVESEYEFAVVIYQADGGQLFWIDEDEDIDVFSGSLQQQSDNYAIPGGSRSRSSQIEVLTL